MKKLFSASVLVLLILGAAQAQFVPTSRTLTEGAGLAGNTYDLSQDRTLAMGQPSTLSLFTVNSASGTTHTHGISASSNPGASASLLATDASGNLQLVNLNLTEMLAFGGGIDPGIASIFAMQAGLNQILTITAGDGFTLNARPQVQITANSIGSTTAELFLFARDDTELSYARFSGLNFSGVAIGGTEPPAALLDVRGSIHATDVFPLVLMRDASGINDGPVIQFKQKNAANEYKEAAWLTGELSDITEGSENGQIRFATLSDGISTVKVTITEGLIVGTPVGGDMGEGAINAEAVFDDGVLLTDWVFGFSQPEKPTSYKRLFALAETLRFTQTEHRLPWMPAREEFRIERRVGGMITRLWQGQEQTMLYIFDLEKRVAELEKRQ